MRRILVGYALVVGMFMVPSGASIAGVLQIIHDPLQAAQPEIAFISRVTVNDTGYYSLSVMDSDGANLSVIYTALSPAHVISAGPSWSPDGKSIAFFQYSTDKSIPYTIALEDVSVVQGVAVGSNLRTLINPADNVRSLSWSSLASTNKIAFTTQLQGAPGTGKVQVISASGGIPEVLYQTTEGNGLHFYYSVTWSPDDSKIAFVDRTQVSGEDSIRIIDAATGTLLEVIALGATNWTYIDWSNAGKDLLVMSWNAKLCYVAPLTNATPWSDNVAGFFPAWSWDNTTVVSSTLNGFSSFQKVKYGTDITSEIGGSGRSPDWKKHTSANSVRRDISSLSSFTFSPNPFLVKTGLHFTLQRKSLITLEVYDLLGNTVYINSGGSYEAGSHEVILDEILQPGTLYARISTSFGEVRTAKLIKED